MNNYSNESLYAKLCDGRAKIQFPEEFFPAVSFVDGVPSMATSRRKSINAIERFYEWTIFCTPNYEIIPDYMNRVSLFYPTSYMLRFRSRQNNVLDLEYDAIFKLSDSVYRSIYVDETSGQETKNKNVGIIASPTYRWDMSTNARATMKVDAPNTVQKIVPISLEVKHNENFIVILENLKSGALPLPEIL